MAPTVETDILHLPDAFEGFIQKGSPEVYIHLHQTSVASIRTKIQLHYHLITFVIKGCKMLHEPNQIHQIEAGELAIIASGNCLMSEKLLTDGAYQALLLFFSPALAEKILTKHAGDKQRYADIKKSIQLPQDDYLKGFVSTLKNLIETGPKIPEQLYHIKLEELLFYVNISHPSLSQILHNHEGSLGDQQRLLTEVVTRNLYQDVNTDELAFLCNMSVSTFKRHFNKQYGMPVGQYFLQAKMEHAARLLKRFSPMEVFHQVGYENYSSFSEAFKHYFGLSPKSYQQERLLSQ